MGAIMVLLYGRYGWVNPLDHFVLTWARVGEREREKKPKVNENYCNHIRVIHRFVQRKLSTLNIMTDRTLLRINNFCMSCVCLAYNLQRKYRRRETTCRHTYTHTNKHPRHRHSLSACQRWRIYKSIFNHYVECEPAYKLGFSMIVLHENVLQRLGEFFLLLFVVVLVLVCSQHIEWESDDNDSVNVCLFGLWLAQDRENIFNIRLDGLAYCYLVDASKIVWLADAFKNISRWSVCHMFSHAAEYHLAALFLTYWMDWYLPFLVSYCQ